MDYLWLFFEGSHGRLSESTTVLGLLVALPRIPRVQARGVTDWMRQRYTELCADIPQERELAPVRLHRAAKLGSEPMREPHTQQANCNLATQVSMNIARTVAPCSSKSDADVSEEHIFLISGLELKHRILSSYWFVV